MERGLLEQRPQGVHLLGATPAAGRHHEHDVLARRLRELDEIGQLSELLVTLGASDDAAKLQRAVGEALEAHERASRIARTTLAALDDAERSAAAAAGRGPDPKRLDKLEPCECPACVRSRKGKCLAAVAAQWKWAALRTGGSS